jgi:pimeloyl-ACP methyl ester carboxylesterase
VSKPILFLHGSGFTGRWWIPQLEALSADYPVGAPDLPGHGQRVSQKFTLDGALAAIDDEMVGPLAPPVLLTGISMGGYVAIAYAARHPEQVAGLVLSGCSLNLNRLTGLGFRATGYLLRLRGAAWLTDVNLRSFRKRVPAALGELIIGAGFHPKTAMATFSALPGTDYHRLLATYPGPILLLNGEDDEPNRKAETQLLQTVPHAVSRPIAGAGHLANLERPTAFTAAVGEFAAACASRSF